MRMPSPSPSQASCGGIAGRGSPNVERARTPRIASLTPIAPLMLQEHLSSENSRGWSETFLNACRPQTSEQRSSFEQANGGLSYDGSHKKDASDDSVPSFQGDLPQMLERIFRQTWYTSCEVRTLQKQVHIFEDMLRQQCNTGIPPPSAAGANDSCWRTGVSAALSSETSGVKEMRVLQQQVNALEAALRHHKAFNQTAESGNLDGVGLASTITGFESRLEAHILALHQADAKILGHCEVCLQSNERMESLLTNGAVANVAPRRATFSGKTFTQTVLQNIDAVDDVGDIGEVDEGVGSTHLRLSLQTPQSTKDKGPAVADLVGSGARWAGTTAEFDDEATTGRAFALAIMDKVSFAMVFVDLVMVGVIIQVSMESLLAREQTPIWIRWIQFIMAFAFGIDITVRVYIERMHFFLGYQVWNYFDLFVTMYSFINASLELTAGAEALGHLNFLRILRFLRVARAARALRKLHQMYECRLIMDCMAHAMVPTLWVFLLLTFTLYITGLVLMQCLEMFITDSTDHPNKIVQLYGGILRTMYTLTMAIAGGVPWRDLVLPLEALSGWFIPFFILFVVGVKFGVLNILAAVFVSFVSRFVNNHIEEHLHDLIQEDSATVEDMRHLLASKSSREDGRISRRRLQRLLEGECEGYLTKLSLEMDAALGIFKMLDTEDTGAVNIDEFVCSILQLKSNPNNIHFATMMYENKKIMMRISKLSRLVEKNFAVLLYDETSDPSKQPCPS